MLDLGSHGGPRSDWRLTYFKTILGGQGEVRPGDLLVGLFESPTLNPDFVNLTSDLRADLLHRDMEKGGGRDLRDFSIV
jgi:hypothetical protein